MRKHDCSVLTQSLAQDLKEANTMFVARQILAALMLTLLSGCGETPDPDLRPVFKAVGSVRFQGRPIPDATIRLHPVSPTDDGKPTYLPRGRVDEHGNFAITTYRTGDGAPPGEYRVSLSWQGPLKGISEDEEDRLQELLPRQFTTPEESGLTVVIAEGENELPQIAIN